MTCVDRIDDYIMLRAVAKTDTGLTPGGFSRTSMSRLVAINITSEEKISWNNNTRSFTH